MKMAENNNQSTIGNGKERNGENNKPTETWKEWVSLWEKIYSSVRIGKLNSHFYCKIYLSLSWVCVIFSHWKFHDLILNVKLKMSHKSQFGEWII